MRKRKNRPYWLPVIIGFTMLYLVTMFLATYLVKVKFTEDYGRTLKNAALDVLPRASKQEFAAEEKGWTDDERKAFYQALIREYHWSLEDVTLQISIAFYDEHQNLLAKSRDEAGRLGGTSQASEGTSGIFALDDYLTPEEKEQLAAYRWQTIYQPMESGYTTPADYCILYRLSPDKQELWGFTVQKLTWTEGEEYSSYTDPLTGSINSAQTGGMVDYATGQVIGEERLFQETDSQVIWEWRNPAIHDDLYETGIYQDAYLLFPYMTAFEGCTYEDWKRWNGREYLHNFPEQGSFSWESGNEYPPLIIDANGISYQGRYQLKIGMIDDPSAYMEIRMESNPWLDAMKYMIYVYVSGLVLTIVCIVKVIWVFRQTYAKQAALEETRRDFTNAMAHELKTPLGVIRNFAENLLEYNMEEKRDYYLTQIIGQTEEMDGLVARMIELSGLDSDSLTLRRETLSLSGLIREQMERFTPVLQEKNIRVQYEENGSFQVDGDKEYLEQAVWNLLSNAVEYNLPGGGILIRTDPQRCIIENDGFPLEEEQLIHAFDLFYTSDKNRSGQNRHMGMGLFLAKKILDLHQIQIKLENTEKGVRIILRH